MAKTTRGSRHLPMIPALVLGLVSLGAPWLVVEVPTGATATAGWSDVAPASFSLALAAIAGWGASLLTGSRATRYLSGAQTLLAAGALLSLGSALGEPTRLLNRLAGEASGVIGAISPAETVSAWSPAWVSVAVIALLSLLASGIWGTIVPDGRGRQQRYQRAEQSDTVDPWQALSDGQDPTSR